MRTRIAERIEVTGIVQGVGFRPFVHRLATELGLDGCVGNDSARVFIEVAGSEASVDRLVQRLVAEAPPLAILESVRRVPCTAAIDDGFEIVASRVVDGERTLVAPDTAACAECVAELFDTDNRRYRHPFITCTNCGPRFTITRALPYDRPNTTMAAFELCSACQREYDDPADRRYHAQPIACHDCGPTLSLLRPDGSAITGTGSRAIEDARAIAGDGGIVAIKGLGGFHLACDATSDRAVADLRARKQRPDKPFAVMVRDLDEARRLAEVSSAEAAELLSPARPIVLLRARSGSPVSGLIAPGNPLIGVMLAYTPVHHLLFSEDANPLTMTSGNLGGQPITHRDDDVPDRIGPLCDAVLTHDRPIHVPCDDSVVRLVDDALLPVRRARGFAPIPVTLRGAVRDVLAVGGELKNTFCVTSGEHAWVSQHVGDMANLETLGAFEASLDHFAVMYATTPEKVAIDAHPAYVTGAWARRLHPEHIIEVQHHHAHIAAVMAEHQLDPRQPIIGFAFDGTGYGTDAAVWGGEVLVATASDFDRAAHLAPVQLPGGDAAVEHPCRLALAHLDAAGIPWDGDLPPVTELDPVHRRLLRRQLDTGIACVPTTSMGRLFDAMSSLLGLRHHITYEAQAAIDLEVAATSSRGRDLGYRFAIVGEEITAAPVLKAVVADLRSGLSRDDIAFGFHVAVGEAVRELAMRIRQQRGLHTVALSGGVFQNALVTRLCGRLLEGEGFDVRTHRLVPPNDGGLALGQAFIAAHRCALDAEET